MESSAAFPSQPVGVWRGPFLRQGLERWGEGALWSIWFPPWHAADLIQTDCQPETLLCLVLSPSFSQRGGKTIRKYLHSTRLTASGPCVYSNPWTPWTLYTTLALMKLKNIKCWLTEYMNCIDFIPEKAEFVRFGMHFFFAGCFSPHVSIVIFEPY